MQLEGDGRMRLHVEKFLLGALLLAGSSAASLGQSTVTLHVGCYGGAFTDVEQRFAAQPFTARTGVKIEWINANPSDHLAKMIASKGRPDPYDVVFLDDDIEAEAIKAGVLGKSGPADLPNLKFLYQQAINKDGYGPAMNFYSTGIAYNVEKFKAAGIPAPTSWADLWNPKLAGHVAVPTLDNTMGHAFLVAAEHLAGGDESTPEKGIDKIAQIKAQSYPGSSPVLDPLLTSGDVWAAPWLNGRTWGLIDRGVPLRFVIPKEGGFFGMTTISVTADTPHRKQALAFVDEVLGPLAQLGMVSEIPYGPTNKLLTPILAAYPDVAKKFPASPADIAKLKLINWDVFHAQYPRAVDLWNRKIASK
jgi:putative spermidine/putrescine transport system substrate-binding protein